MKVVTQQTVSIRSMELYAGVEAIQDEELKEGAMEFAKQRIEDMRKRASLFDDDAFFSDIIEMVESCKEKYFEDGVPKKFEENLSLLKSMIDEEAPF